MLTLSAQAALRFDVFLGYDGLVPEGSWFPVVCEVNNDGPSFNAIVEIAPGQYNQGQNRRMALELPTGTTKRFVIPVFSASRVGSYTTWDARLMDQKERVLIETLGIKPRKQFNCKVPLFAAIARSSVVLPALRQPGETQVEWQPGVARLQPNVFPDNPIALEGLTAIYLNAEKALDLKVNQVNALLAWVNAGGHLVVGVEQILHVQGNEWLRQILPCELTALRTKAQHSELQAWLRSDTMNDGKEYPFFSQGSSASSSVTETEPTAAPPPPLVRTNRAGRRPPPPPRISPRIPATLGPLRNPFADLTDDALFEQAPIQVATGSLRDGTALIGPSDMPLAIMGRRGRGQITVLTFSPELEPFLSWKNRPWFWAKMLGMPPEFFTLQQLNRYTGESIDGVLGTMIETKQVRKLPVGWLLLLLVGYLLVIGPLDQYWLKKINRQMLTWVTFPAYVAGFSVLIYLIGYKLRAGETEWNELHVVDIIPFGEKADLRGRTFASVYSPANARYRLASDQPVAALRGEYQRGQESSRAIVEQRGSSYAAEISVPVWTSQLYVEDWLRREDAPLGFSISADGNNWHLQVNNLLNRKIKDARLVIDGRILVLPEIPARQLSRFTLARYSGQPLSQFVQNQSGTFQTLSSQRHQAFGRTQRYFDVINGVMAASFVSQMDEPQRRDHPRYPYENGSRFITVPGLDLSALVQRGDAILLAWVPEFSLVKASSKFTPRRSHKNTLLRIAAELKAEKAENQL